MGRPRFQWNSLRTPSVPWGVWSGTARLWGIELKEYRGTYKKDVTAMATIRSRPDGDFWVEVTVFGAGPYPRVNVGVRQTVADAKQTASRWLTEGVGAFESQRFSERCVVSAACRSIWWHVGALTHLTTKGR